MLAINKINSETMVHSLLGIMIFLSLVSYHQAYYIPDTLKWICIAFVALIVLVTAVVKKIRGLVANNASIQLDSVDIGLLIFTSYAALSLLWSPDQRGGLLSLIYWALLCVVITAVKNTHATRQASNLHFIILVAVSLASIFALITQQRFPERWGGFYNENFLTEFLLLTLPFVAGLTWAIGQATFKPMIKYGLITIGFALLCWIAIYLVEKNPSKLEFFILPATCFVILIGPLWRISRGFTIFIVTAVLAALCALVYFNWGESNGYRDSLIPRFALIFDTLLMWWQAPILGHGAGAFPYLFAGFQELHFQYFPQLSFSVEKFGLARSAHNDYLEFLSDFGLLGLMLLALPIVAVVNRLIKQSKSRSSLNVVLCVGIVVIVMLLANAALEFPLQNPATALLAAIAFGFLAHTAELPVIYRIRQPLAVLSVAMIFVVLSCANLYGAWRLDGAQKAYRKMAELYYIDPQAAFEANAEAHRLNPLDFRIRVQLYESLVHWNRALGMPPLAAEQYDAVYSQARTAGPQALMMLRRVEYLLDTGRYQERAEELSSTLIWLRTHFSRKADVWIADAYYHLLMGRVLAANLSLAQAKLLALDEQQKQRIAFIETTLQNQGGE